MPIPDFQTCMLPLLKFLADGEERRLNEATRHLALHFQLSDEEQNELLPSGQQPVFPNRIGWARSYLKKAGLLDSTRRGCFRITERGRQLLTNPPERITVKYLDQYPEFRLFWDRYRTKRDATIAPEPEELEVALAQTPQEALESAYIRLKEEIAGEVLQTLKNVDPAMFERLVVDVLVEMGYGGNKKEAGRAIGKRGDEGIDGIIKEDHLGLDSIYIQAKRWEGTVGRPEVQKFAGALQGQRARKGIFITTSAFTAEAKDFVSHIESKIVLIDGPTLVDLMIEFGVGVSTVSTYVVKKLNADYFGES